MNLKDILIDIIEDTVKSVIPKFELNTLYSNPQHTAFSINESVEKKLYILVGLTSTDKDKFIKTLSNPVTCSGERRISMNKCLDNMLMTKPTIVIDNKNLTDSDRLPYENMATKYGYEIVYVLFEPNKKKLKSYAKKNLQSSEAANIEVMLDKYVPPSGEKGKIIYIKQS